MRALAFFFAALLGAIGSTRANEWLLPFDPAPPDALRVDHLVADGDGYLMVGRAGQDTRWVRVDSDGAVQVSAPSESWASLPAQLDNALVPLAAGRFLIRPVERQAQCLLPTVDVSGNTLAVAGIALELLRACEVIQMPRTRSGRLPVLDGVGGLWLERPNNNFWMRMQADGELQALVPPADATASFRFSAIPDAVAAYALYRAGPQMKLALMTPSRVEWTHAFPAGFDALDVLTTSDGDALVTGRHSSTNAPFVARFRPDGGLRFSSILEAAVAPPGFAWVLTSRLMAGDHLALVLQSLGGTATVYGVSARDGALRWTHAEDGRRFENFVPGPFNDPRHAPAVLAYFVRSYGDPDVPAGERVAIDFIGTDGTRRRHLPGAVIEPETTASLADGSLVYLLPDGQGSNVLRHVSADGSSLAVPNLKQLVPRLWQTGRVGIASGGSTVLVDATREQRFRVSEWSAEGQLLWQRQLNPEREWSHVFFGPTQDLQGVQARLASNTERVCVGPIWSRWFQILWFNHMLQHSLTCIDRSDGLPIYSLPTSLSAAGQNLVPLPDLGLREDGSVVMVMSGSAGSVSTGLHRVVVDAAGSIASVSALPSQGLGRESATHFASDGRIAVVDSHPERGLEILLIDADGSASQAIVQNALLGSVARVRMLGDSSLMLLSANESEFLLSRILPSGVVTWSRRYERPQLSSSTADADLVFAVEAAELLVVSQQPQDGRMRSTMEAIDIATGASRWERTLTLHEDRGLLDLAIDASQGLVWVSRSRPGEILLAAHALADGAELGKRALPCQGTAVCSPSSLFVADDDSLRMVGGLARIARIESASVQASAPAAQQALLGTWYSPGTDGQGLLIDYSASSGDLLAGWFTYTGEDVYSASGLRWFTLAAAVEPDAEEAELTIYRNEGGRFALAPITEAVEVGSARLRLNRCNQAVLSYQFDAGEHAGLQGEIGLQRLTPPLFACRDQDGSVIPPAARASAGSALQAGQSGAWYAPESSGQGFLLDLRPPAEGDDGLLVGGWFTYDPAGQADDPTAQHWFLLEGSLADAVGSTLIVPIYRASGGRFDQRSTRNVHRVGDVTIDFQGCTAAALTYRFDDSDIAGGFAGREGQMALVKLLPCHQ